MKKILIFILSFFIFIYSAEAWYKLENWSLNLVEKYNFNTSNLDKEITRKEFVETLYSWYFDYKKDRWINIDYNNYKKIDNEVYFKDIDLESDFWKKVSYFVWLWSFSKREYFDPNWLLNQRDYFTVMKRLRIMFSLQNCKYHRICEKEITKDSMFVKWTYFKYTSKILDKKLRKYYSKPSDYLEAWYKSFLKPSYRFPLKWQTLNWCYAFSIRNILKYKHWIWIYIPKAEKIIGKKPENLWYSSTMKKFDDISHVKVTRLYNLDTFINSLQAWEPLAITYSLDYYSWKEKKMKSVLHIVAAYSFDEDWVWVAETVKAKRTLVPWDEVFNMYWNLSNRRMFKYDYIPKSEWTQKEIDFEKENNILVGEH